MWSWPKPGVKYIEDNNYIKSNVDNIQISDNFILLKINILLVDQLLLHKPIHIRRRWIKKKDWIMLFNIFQVIVPCKHILILVELA